MVAGFYFTDSDARKVSHTLTRAMKIIGKQEAPFYNLLQTFAPETQKLASLQAGFTWEYAEEAEGQSGDNAHFEGGDPAAVEHYVSKLITNHMQIWKVSYGLTRTAIKQNGTTGLPFQEQRALVGLTKDINKSLVKNTTAVQRVGTTTKGKTMGLYGLFSTNNEIDAAGKDVNSDLLEDVCVAAMEKGINLTHFLVSSKQTKKLNALFRDTYRTEYGVSEFKGTDVQKVSNIRGLNGTINRVFEPLIDDTDIVLIDINRLGFMSFDEKHGDEITTTKDGSQYQHLVEGCLYYSDPFAVWRIKGLKED